MAKKLLIAGGCSYTDKKYTAEVTPGKHIESWTMWPEHLGKKLNLEVINTGNSGSSNESIFHNVMEKILTYKKRVDTVAVLWSEFDRSRFYGIFDWMPLSETNIYLNENPMFPDGKGEFTGYRDRLNAKKFFPEFFKSQDFYRVRDHFIRACIHDTFRYIIMLAEYCEANNIKYIFFQGLGPFQWERMNYFSDRLPFQYDGPEEHRNSYMKIDQIKYINFYANNIWFSTIEKKYKKNIIGWPSERLISGFTLDDIRYWGKSPFTKRDDQWNATDVDMHPNKEAQSLCAEVFYDHWRELYG